jgi:hypothetical protein
MGKGQTFTNAITEPKQVLKGGYLSWYDSETKTWWQRSWFGSKASDEALTGFKATNGNLREALDRYRELERAKVMGRVEESSGGKRAAMARRGGFLDHDMLQAPGRAAMLRETIAAVSRRK